MATSIARLAIDLLVNSSGLQKDFSKAMKPINKFGREMTAIGKDLTMKVTAPIAGMGIGILKAAGDFEAGMNRVGAITGATAGEFAALRDRAKELGATTQFSATEAAGGIEMLAKNGLKYQQIVDGALESTLKLSAATGSDLSRAADIATDAMLAFGIQAEGMSAAVDQITGVTLNSKFDIEGYSMALANAGAVAAKSGVEFSDFNAAITAIAPSFSSGMTAGTSFKTFLARLVPTSKPAIEAMNELGLSFFNSKGELDDMATISEKLKDKLGGLSEEARLSKGIQIFGTEGVRGAFALMDAGADKINEFKAALADTSAAEQAEARMKGLNGAMIKLTSALEAVAISIADSGLLEFATNLVVGVTDLFSSLSKTNPEILKWGTVIAGAAAALGPLILGIGTLATALAPVMALIAAKGGLVASMAALANPVTAAVAAIVALTAGYIAFKDEIDAFLTDTFSKMFMAWERLKIVLNENLDTFNHWVTEWEHKILGWDKALMVAFTKVGGYIVQAGDYFLHLQTLGAKVFKQIGLFVQQMVARVENWLADKLLKITEKAGKGVDALKEKFRAMADAVVFNSYVPDMVTGIGKEAKRMESIFTNPILEQLDNLTGTFKKAGLQTAKINIIPTTQKSKGVQAGGVQQYEQMGDKIGESILSIMDGFDGVEGRFEDVGKSILRQFKGILGGLDKESKGFDIGSIFGLGGAGNIFSGGGGGLGGILGSVGNIFSGGSGLGGILSNLIPGGGILSGLGSIFGGFFAKGGTAQPNRLSVVGENGPELLMPKSATSVIPASKLGGISSNGGATVILNQTNHFEGGVQVPQVAEMLKSHGRELVKGMQDQIQRGGSFRQSFQS